MVIIHNNIHLLINYCVYTKICYRAKKITTCYPEYSVQFDGIGAGPSGTENIGCCSQMALFYRKDMTTSPVKPIVRCFCNYF